MIKVGIVGVAGYGGGELARLLLGRNDVELTYVVSKSSEGKLLSSAFPGAMGRTSLVCKAFDLSEAIDLCDVIFLAQENGFAMKVAGDLLSAGKKVIDLSADFRLKDLSLYPKFYKFEHAAPNLLSEAVYGLPELNRESIKGASLIANPGCYATASALSMAPLVCGGLVNLNSIVINALSGVSGAGRSKHSLAYHFPELNESMAAYAVAGAHRHTPEIEQTLSIASGTSVTLSFTPHLIPITRGIIATSVAGLVEKSDAARLTAVFRDFYKDSPFVIVLDPGGIPASKFTAGTNYVYLSIAVDERLQRVSVFAAEDNLVKGAAGQAIQNMNLILGLPETEGLQMAAIWP
jgi:N-acetyl-gamma-glutamyl-phosphate reductase